MAGDVDGRAWVAGSIDELIAGADARIPVRTADARSGATFERLSLGGRPHFLKVLSADADWIMRVTGNTSHWELRVWSAGLYHGAPEQIDHAMVGMALEGEGPAARLAMLMEDRSADLVPPGDAMLPIGQHHRFLDHLAAMHAALLGWQDHLGLCSMTQRLRFFAPATIAPELQAADVPGPIAVANQGWSHLPRRAPGLDALVRGVHDDPTPLLTSLASTPTTFVAGDWKLGNLGSRDDGRTVLLDWAYPGAAPPCWELAWYLALNRARMPESKDEAVRTYRRALERRGVDTTGWFERQMDVCLLAIMATFAWEKAVGPDDELQWWVAAAERGARWLS